MNANESGNKNLLENVPANSIQPIRGLNVSDLQKDAARLGHHFLYAYCANFSTKQQILTNIARSFYFPKYFGKNFDALYDCLTDITESAGEQPGFVVVLDRLPETAKFDKNTRESLLEVFKDAADFWGDKKIAFRVFYSFA